MAKDFLLRVRIAWACSGSIKHTSRDVTVPLRIAMGLLAAEPAEAAEIRAAAAKLMLQMVESLVEELVITSCPHP
eukprot:2545261-Amphidinium_carterae.1